VSTTLRWEALPRTIARFERSLSGREGREKRRKKDREEKKGKGREV